MRDRVVERGLGAGRRPARFDAPLELGGEDRPEHEMRFGVLRVDGQGLAGGAGGVLGAVGARVEGGDLGGNGRALRVGLGGQPIRFERLRDLAEGFEVSAANELEVGCGRRGLRRPRLRPGGERRAESGPEGRQEHQRRATRHEIELFHAASVLTRAGAPVRRPPRNENPAGAAAAHRRRGVHDAGRHRHPRRLSRGRDHVSGGAGRRAGRPGPSRHRRRQGGAAPARLAADRRRPGARPASCAAPASTWSSISTAARARRS